MLIDLGSWEVALDAASAKNTRQGGRARKQISERKKVPLRDRHSVLVFCAGAGFRRRVAEAKYISTREMSQAEKKTKF